MGLPVGIAPSRSLKTLNCWIFKDLDNKVGVPFRFTVSGEVEEIFDISRKQVAAVLMVRVRVPKPVQT